MAKFKNLHFPDELKPKPAMPAKSRARIRAWKKTDPEYPAAPSGLKIDGVGSQLADCMGLRREFKFDAPRPLDSPHGLLFRAVDNYKFISRVLYHSWDYAEGAPERMSYFGNHDNTGTAWTSCVALLRDLFPYTQKWKHFSEINSNRYQFESIRVAITAPRILLLAIDPVGRELFLGADDKSNEVSVKGKIDIGRVYILNDSNELLYKLLTDELLHSPEDFLRNMGLYRKILEVLDRDFVQAAFPGLVSAMERRYGAF
ncbi:MAG TPA: hypothetical protein VLD37_03750 [Candidatus Bilamarchaeum sp.]|nr:hypothetical protein [Candidatus Bilamarchaeum sp.]